MPIFGVALKHQIRECILSLFWRRADLYRFFLQCQVPTSSLSQVNDWEEKNLPRVSMIDLLFDSLDRRPDRGTIQFEVMLGELVAWQDFNSYWFTQGNLDSAVAIQQVEVLRVAKRDDLNRTRKRFEDHRSNEEARTKRHLNLEEMRAEFQRIATGSDTPQQRGYAFEGFLAKLMRHFGLTVTSPFRVTGTQIDGSVKYDGEHYLIEAKWLHHSLSDEPLMAFCHKQLINMHGRGIFISLNGFVPGALTMLEHSAAKSTVLVDGEDLAIIMDGHMSFPQVLDAKVQAAQTRGRFYVHPLTLESKLVRAA